MESTGPSPASGTQWMISAAGHQAVVVEVGGGLRTYRSGGVDHVDGYAPDEMCPASAGQVLAPWPNRLRDGRYAFGGESHQLALTEPTRQVALHGLVNWARWSLVQHTGDSVTVGYDLPPQPGYPWPLRLRTRWSVGLDGLTAEHEVTSTGGEECPFGFSVHPYLRVPGVAVDDMLLTVPGRTRMLLDARLLPIGMAPVAGGEYDYTAPRRIGQSVLDVAWCDLDHDADGGSAVELTGPDGTGGVTVWADEAFRWWQVFTADALSGPRRRRSVAVEPMTCPSDAFRSGRDVIVLQPGQTWRASWGIRPRD